MKLCSSKVHTNRLDQNVCKSSGKFRIRKKNENVFYRLDAIVKNSRFFVSLEARSALNLFSSKTSLKYIPIFETLR